MTLILLSGLAVVLAFFVGYTVGTTQTWRELQSQINVLRAHVLDLMRQLDECNGVKDPPAEAGK